MKTKCATSWCEAKTENGVYCHSCEDSRYEYDMCEDYDEE